MGTEKQVVLVPWRTDNGSRELIWSEIRKKYWDENKYYIIEGSCDDGPFNRSQAINNAFNTLLDGPSYVGGDVLVIADADSWVPSRQLEDAVELARFTGKLVIAHNGTWMNDKMTVDHAVSSMLAVPVELFIKVNGFDERFRGWGCEDRAFHRICKLAAGDPVVMTWGTPVFHKEHEREVAPDILYQFFSVFSIFTL